MKASILQPVVWNTRNYIGPSGCGASNGYPADRGFGHEEWNNDDRRIWQGYRVFHTESTDRLLQYSQDGELGMLIIASHDGLQYAVGAAAGVFHNSEDEMRIIAREIDTYSAWEDLWSLAAVKKAHSNEAAFLKFWRKAHYWIQWKVDPSMYHWFSTPVLLHPKRLSGKSKLVNRFGRFQRIPPAKVAAILRDHLPKKKAALAAWFEEDGFDERFLAGKPPLAKKASATKKAKQGGGNAPTDRIVRYWVYGEHIAEPLHADLQSCFVEFLRKKAKKDIVQDQEFVDVKYRDGDGLVLAEVKPTQKVKPKYAIRNAIGQLYEYRHTLGVKARLEIVISSVPEAAQVGLLKSLDIRLWLRKGKGAKFARLA